MFQDAARSAVLPRTITDERYYVSRVVIAFVVLALVLVAAAYAEDRETTAATERTHTGHH